MALAEKSDLKSWAEPVLTVGNKVLIAKGKFGQGKVVWSGMNIFAHAHDKANQEEYRLIGNIFEFLIPPGTFEEGQVAIDWDFPDRIELTLTQVPSQPSFLYWAETFTPDWQAYFLKNGKKQPLKIYRAGSGFKAVRLEDVSGGDKLILEYSLKKIFFLSFGITFTLFFVLLILILDVIFWHRALERKIKGRFSGAFNLKKTVKDKISKAVRWDDEED